MSAADLAAVAVTVVVLVAVGMLVVVAIAMVRALRELRRTVDVLRGETVATVIELRRTVEHAGDGLDRVDGLIESAERITGTVDSASRLTYRAITPPLIKTMSFMAGTARAARRLRGRPSPHPIDVRSVEHTDSDRS